jgi:O-antigen ligase
VALALTVASVLVIATALGALSSGQLAPHLPREALASPWDVYLYATNEGLGAIGYNHGYVALHLLALLVLRFVLSDAANWKSDGFLMACCILAIGFSGSRAGLVGALVFALFYALRRPRIALSMSAAVLAVAVVAASAFASSDNVQIAVNRQLTLGQTYDSDNLSGRDDIWAERLRFLNEEPVRWLVGTGFGSSFQSGNNAHMLFLQVVLETGLLGLLAFGFLVALLIRLLWKADCNPYRPALFGVIAFLLSGITQETFYPVPAFGTFLLLFATICSVAIKTSPPRLDPQPLTARP